MEGYMDFGRCLTAIGVVIQLLGAFYMVLAASRARKDINRIRPETFGGVGEMALVSYRLVKSQFVDRLAVFSLFGVGSTAQLVSILTFS